MSQYLLYYIVPVALWILLVYFQRQSTESNALQKTLSELQNANIGLKDELRVCKADLKDSLKSEKKPSKSQDKTSSGSAINRDKGKTNSGAFDTFYKQSAFSSGFSGFSDKQSEFPGFLPGISAFSPSKDAKADRIDELEKELEIKTSHITQLKEKLKKQVALVAKYKLLLQDFRDKENGNKHFSVPLDDNNVREDAADDSIRELELLLEVLRERNM